MQRPPTLNNAKVGKISEAQIAEIAKLKMPDLNSFTLESAIAQAKGACVSMGVFDGNTISTRGRRQT